MSKAHKRLMQGKMHKPTINKIEVKEVAHKDKMVNIEADNSTNHKIKLPPPSNHNHVAIDSNSREFHI